MLTEIKGADIHSPAVQDAQPAAGTAYQHCTWVQPPRGALATDHIFPNKQAHKCIPVLNHIQLKSDPLNQFNSPACLVYLACGNTARLRLPRPTMGLWLEILHYSCLPRIPIFQTKGNFNIGNSGNSSWGKKF